MTALLKSRPLRLLGASILVLLLATIVWLLTTEHEQVWPVRNTLEYRLAHWWGLTDGLGAQTGTVVGTVRGTDGQPITGARVLLAEWNGATHSARSDKTGTYRIEGVPVGRYVPVAGAPGFANKALRGWGFGVSVAAEQELRLDIELATQSRQPIEPGEALEVGEAQPLTCQAPVPSQALRRSVRFMADGRVSQPMFLYTPVTGTLALPTILAVYPGPADGWECASLPLAQAGYAVLAVGPAYALDLERDIDDLERLLGFVHAGAVERADPQRVAAVAGSYSGLHVLRLLQRNPGLRAVLLLGPPTDLFDMRRRLENRSFVPPYGLDQALVALGLPNRTPERYWRYSGAYHVAPDWPPLALLHSRADEVVPVAQSELLANELRTVGVPHQILFFDGAQHYLLGDPDQVALVYQTTLAFLGEHLQAP